MGMIKTTDICKIVDTSEGSLVILEGITLEITKANQLQLSGPLDPAKRPC